MVLEEKFILNLYVFYCAEPGGAGSLEKTTEVGSPSLSISLF